MRPEFAAMVTLIALLIAGTTIAMVLRGPLGKALARRVEGRYGTSAEDSPRVQELEQRVAELEHAQVRVSELEERVDFAERLLSRGTEATAPLRDRSGL